MSEISVTAGHGECSSAVSDDYVSSEVAPIDAPREPMGLPNIKRTDSERLHEPELDNRRLLKRLFKQLKWIRQFYFITRKLLENLEAAQQAQRQQRAEELQILESRITAVDERIFKEAQMSRHAVQDLKSEQRSGFVNLTINVRNLRLDVQEVPSTFSIMAEQMKKSIQLKNAPQQSCIEKIEGRNNREEKRKQSIEKIDAQMSDVEFGIAFHFHVSDGL